MSDPVSNADIEDVLSSIRRLVSEEPAGQAARPPAASEAEVERFVLTPALRVVEEEPAPPTADGAGEDGDGAAMAADADIAEPAPPSDAWQDDAPTGEDAGPHMGQNSPPEDVQAALDTDDPAPALAPDLEPQIAAAFESDTEWVARPAGPAGAGADPAAEIPAVDAVDEAADVSLERRIAELEAAIQQAPQEWEPDGSEDGSSDLTRPLSFDPEGSKAALAEALAPGADEVDDADEVKTKAADAFEPVAEAEDAAFARISDAPPAPEPFDEPGQPAPDAGLDAAEPRVDAIDDEVSPPPEAEPAPPAAEAEPEGDVEDVEDVEAVAERMTAAVAEWQDVAAEPDPSDSPGNGSAEPASAPSSEPAETPFAAKAGPGDAEGDAQVNLLAEDETMLDEESLREMVADLVRQELQGVLGERITRNVRRLVRREIQRALAMRDLE